MKYLLATLFIVANILFISCEKDDDSPNGYDSLSDSLFLGQGYPNDVFYSLSDGVTSSKARNNWDIGFRTTAMSSSIIINRGAGVLLYEISKDTSDWYDIIDTTGHKSWPVLNNSIEEWEEGAFSGNMTNHPDYGWGKYDDGDHNLYGSAVYLIIGVDGTAKKIFIRKKHSVAMTYYFLYADLNGDNVHSVVLDLSNLQNKEYVYYSLSSNNIVDDQPEKNDWDLWFTKYLDPEIGQQQLVTGVLINPSAKAMRVEGVTNEAADTTMGTYSDQPGIIGYNWKTVNYTTGEYSIVENLTFFIKTSDKEVYRLYFTGFDRSTGKAAFVKKRIK